MSIIHRVQIIKQTFDNYQEYSWNQKVYSRHNWKIVDWDIKNQIKQTYSRKGKLFCHILFKICQALYKIQCSPLIMLFWGPMKMTVL